MIRIRMRVLLRALVLANPFSLANVDKEFVLWQHMDLLPPKQFALLKTAYERALPIRHLMMYVPFDVGALIVAFT